MEEFVIDYSGNDHELFGGLVASLTHFTVFFLKSEAFSNILNFGRRCIQLDVYDPPESKTLGVTVITGGSVPPQDMTIHIREHHSSASIRT